jgi:hypothetical protein
MGERKTNKRTEGERDKVIEREEVREQERERESKSK